MLIYALCFIYFTYDEELVILYWGFSEGSEGFTPPNPQATPSEQWKNNSEIIQLDRSLNTAVTGLSKNPLCLNRNNPYFFLLVILIAKKR